MTTSEVTKLANEIAQAAPVPDWSDVDELAEMRHHVTSHTLKGDFEHVLNFSQTVALYKELDAEVKSRETQMKALKEAIQAAVMVSGHDKVRCGDYRLNLITKKGSERISRELLLGLGVEPIVIAKATEIGKASQYIDIRKDKD